VKFVRLIDQNLPDEAGVIQLIDMQRPQLVMSDVSKVASNTGRKRKRVEGEPLGPYLACDDGQKVKPGAVWILSSQDRPTSENQLQSELDLPRRSGGGGDQAG
jgi:hypothetical protein